MTESKQTTEQKKPLFILWVLISAVVIAAVLLGVWWLCYHYHSDIARWTNADSRDSLMISADVLPKDNSYQALKEGDEIEYLLAGEYEKDNLTSKKIVLQEVIGELTIEDKKTALYNVILIATVKDNRDVIVLIDENGDKFVYYKKGTDNPAVLKKEDVAG